MKYEYLSIPGKTPESVHTVEGRQVQVWRSSSGLFAAVPITSKEYPRGFKVVAGPRHTVEALLEAVQQVLGAEP